MKQSKKKRRKSSSSRKGNAENGVEKAGENEQKALKNALEAFASVSVREAEMNPDKLKKVIASAGTVSTMLGKDYVRSTTKKGSGKLKGFYEQSWSNEEAEEFLYAMLGDDCELSQAVVSDVFCQCGYNLDKALDPLLELSAPSNEQPGGCYESTSEGDAQYILESNNSVLDSASDSTSPSSDIELQDNVWFVRNPFGISSKNSESSGSRRSTKTTNLESELPQKVLESLFSMPTPKAAENEGEHHELEKYSEENDIPWSKT